MELKLAWATFPTHVAALAVGRTIVGVGPYVPFTAASFAPGSLFWLVPCDPDTELREHYRPAYHVLFDQARAVSGTAFGPSLKRLEVCARVYAVLARLDPRQGVAFEAFERLGDEVPWTAERLRELAQMYGALTLFALEVARASAGHTLQRRVPATSQLGVRPLDPGTLHPVLPPEVLARRVAALRAVLGGLAARLPERPRRTRPEPCDRSGPAGVRRGLEGTAARRAEGERVGGHRPAGLASQGETLPAPAPEDALSGTAESLASNGAVHHPGGLEGLKQRIAADVLLPAEWSAELQECCDLALESPRHAVAACRRLLQHVIAAAHAVHCRGRSAVGFQARADDLRNAGCISDLSRRWLLALWDIGTAALHEDVRGWNEQDTEAMVLGTWRVLSAERRSLAVQSHQALAADAARRNGKQHATDVPPGRTTCPAGD